MHLFQPERVHQDEGLESMIDGPEELGLVLLVCEKQAQR